MKRQVYNLNCSELKIARIRRNYSSKNLAKKLKWTPAVYSYKENGIRPLSLEDAKRIAEVLNLSPVEILLIFFDIDVNEIENKELE